MGRELVQSPPLSSAPSTPKQVDALTGFRALAAALVFFGHGVRPGNVGALWWLHYGWTGVNLFFALSGFLFTLLYFDRFATTGVPLRDYFLKRAFRVLPLTWLLVAITVLTVGHFRPGDIVSHLTLTQAFFRRYRFSINPPMWTLSVEESFYILVPVLFTCLGALEKMRAPSSVRGRLALIFVVLAIMAQGFSATLADVIALKDYFSGFWDGGLWPMTLLGRFSEFAFGIAAGLVALRCEDGLWLRERTRATMLVVGGALVWLTVSLWMESLGGVNAAGSSRLFPHMSKLHGLGGALMILGLYGRSWFTPLFASRPVVYAGRISFALYLVQYLRVFTNVNLMDHVARILRRYVHIEPVALCMEYLAVSVVAAALYHAVEVPSQRYLRARFLREK